MILKTDKVVVGHVRQRVLHKFLTHHDGWAVQFINLTDHVIEEKDQIVPNTVIPVPPGHNCQEIEVNRKKYCGLQSMFMYSMKYANS